jgi:hypothetical protein
LEPGSAVASFSQTDLIESALEHWKPEDDPALKENLKLALSRWEEDFKRAQASGNERLIKHIGHKKPQDHGTRESAKHALEAIVRDYASRLKAHAEAGSVALAVNDLRELQGAAETLHLAMKRCGPGARLFLDTAFMGQPSPPDAIDLMSELEDRVEDLSRLAAQGVVKAETHAGKGGRRTPASILWGGSDLFLMRLCLERLKWCPKGQLARFAKLLHEAGQMEAGITADPPKDSWGEDAAIRARKWWGKLEPWWGLPKYSWPQEAWRVWADGPAAIESPKQKRNARGRTTGLK